MQNFSFKRLTAWLLTFVMLVSLVPANVSASVIDEFLGDVSAYFRSQGDSASASGAMINAATTGMDVETFGSRNSDPVVVIAGSDYQASGASGTMQTIMNRIKKDYGSVYGALLGGDYDGGDGTTTAADIEAVDDDIDAVFPEITADHRIYLQGNHESLSGLDPNDSNLMNETGAYDTDYYGVYAINHKDYPWSYSNPTSSLVQSTAAGLDEYLDAKADEQYDKPIFVMSHLPLHYSTRTSSSGDGQYAKYLYDVLDEAGDKGLNIIFLFGHNHSSTYDDYLGGGQIYLEVGDSICVAEQDSKNSYFTDTLSFTYLNYGYVGVIKGNAGTNLSMTSFEIADDQVIVNRYGTSGTVKLKAKGVTTSGAPTADTSTVASGAVIELNQFEPAAALTGISVTAPAKTAYVVGDALDTTGMVVTASYDDGTTKEVTGYEVSADLTSAGTKTVTVTYKEKTATFEITVYAPVKDETTGVTVAAPGISDLTVEKITEDTPADSDYSAYVSYDINPVGYTSGSAVVTVPVPESFDAGKPVQVLDGDTVLTTTTIKDGTVTFTATHFSVYSVAQAADSALEWKEIPRGTTYRLDTDGVSTGADYLIVSTGEDGTAQALRNNNGSVASAEVTISNGQIVTNETDIVWTYDSSKYISNGSHFFYLSYNNPNSFLSSSKKRTVAITSNNASEGAYTVKREEYDYYLNYNNGSWTNGSSADDIYFFVEFGTGNGGYAAMTGKTVYNIITNTTDEDTLKTKIRDNLIVYTASDANGTDAAVTTEYSLTGTVKTTEAGDYTYNVTYGGVVLGTVTVNVTDKEIDEIILSDNSGTVNKGASSAATTGATLTVKYEDGTSSEPIAVTVGMLTDANGNSVSTSTIGTITDLYVNYSGQKLPFTLTVAPKEGNNYPNYPDPGAVKVNKTATGIDFQASGVATVELSASGIPMNEGVDVVIVLDTSGSMSQVNKYPDENGTEMYRIELLRPAVNNLIQQMKTKREDGSDPDIDIAIVTFNGNTVKQGTNVIGSAGYRGTNYGIKTGDGSVAGAWEKISEISSTWATDNRNANTPTATGTNYDYGLQMAYDLLAQKKADSEDERLQFVLFLSDGSPSQYNGVESNDGVAEYRNWIRGNYDDTDTDTSNNIPEITNKEFYTGYNYNNGQLHRSAEAIKAANTDTVKIIRFNSSGVGTLEAVEGLGATVYSIGLLLEDGSARTEEDQITVLKTIASDESRFYNIDSVNDLSGAFSNFANEVLLAATNARFEDQMGAMYDLQLTPVDYLPTGETTNYSTINPIIEVRSYEIWTRAEYEAKTITDPDLIGTRKTNEDGSYKYTTLETITFHYTKNGNNDYTLTRATSDQLGDVNILSSSVVCGKYFYYNTTSAPVTVDGITVGAETFYWKLGDIKTTELAIRYNVYLTGALDGKRAAGSYDTNQSAILYYDNYLGNPCKKEAVSPTMAWKGAVVRYAFYLVDASSGKPVNNEGVEVPFSNRTVIVTPTDYANINLFSSEDVESEEIAAEHVLPDGYWLYDERASYNITVRGNGTGAWSISGDTTLSNPYSTYVTDYDGDKYTYENSSNVTGHDYTHTTVWFALKWEPQTMNDTVVIDYGLPVDIHVLTNDLFGKYGKLIGVTKGDVTATASKTENSVTDTFAEGNYGTAVVDVPETGYTDANSVIQYTLTKDNGMQMNTFDVFTYSVNYANPVENKNDGFYYGTLTIIPATSIYYEETFLTFTNYDGSIWSDESAQTGSGFWSQIQDGYEDDVTQSEDRPGNINFAFDTVVDANNIYGYDPSYSNYTKYSLGQAMKVTVDESINKFEFAPKATFTFKGSGFDVVSLTDYDSGVIKVTATSTSDSSNTKTMLVNNYYGYDYGFLYDSNGTPIFLMGDGKTTTKQVYKSVVNADGTKKLVALTLTKETLEAQYNIADDGTLTPQDSNPVIVDAKGQAVKLAQGFYVDPTSTDAIYQVPVIKMDLDSYDEYNVEISVIYLYTQDMHKDDTNSYSFWMDAVRIYDPAGGTSDEIDDTIEDAYKDDKESYPDYKEIGDLLIEQNALSTDPDTPGVVFIDGRDEVKVAVSDYSNPGPNNEVYLAEGQGIAFSLTASKKPLSTQIGAKLAYGSNGVLMYNGEQLLNNGLSTATDMYYEIEVNWTGDDTNGWTSDVIVLSNGNESTLGTNVISLTNIKNTFDVSGSIVSVGTAAQAAEVGVFMMQRLYTPAPEVFVPETFEADYSSNKNGKDVTVTVTASTDVEVITINGIEMSRYKEKKGVRTWTYKPKNNELADLYEIVAFNADGLASEPICAGSENTDDLLVAETYSSSMSQNVVNNLQKYMEKLANRIFTPEKFNKKLEKLADGAELMVVNTSEDVEYIIADGEILRNYITETIIDLSKDGEEIVNRVWLVPNADENAEIAAYNAEGVASEVQNND